MHISERGLQQKGARALLPVGQAVLRFVKLSVAFLTFQGESNSC